MNGSFVLNHIFNDFSHISITRMNYHKISLAGFDT